MRSSHHVVLGLGLISALAFGAAGCRDDIHVNSRHYNEAPRTGTLVDAPWNTGRPPASESTTAPSAIGGGPASPQASNAPTGANDEGSPTMSEEPLSSKPDALEQAAGTPQPPAP